MIHDEATVKRWPQIPLLEQLSHVGCEVDRTIYWKNNNNPEYSRNAFYRALELLTLTILDPKNRGPRRRELARAREALIDHFVYDNEYHSTDESWHQYFFDFNYAAALARKR